MDRQRAKVLHKVEELQGAQDVTIIKISEQISGAFGADASVRTSDASSSSLDSPTPATLEADLVHYKELFAKLRFSYVEQITKEKFIQSVVGDPPLIVSPQENAELERGNAAAKAALRALKLDVADLVAELERRGRELGRRHARVQLETTTLRELPGKMAALEERAAELRAARQPGAKPLLDMPLARTLDLAEEKKAQRHELDRQLEQLRSQVPRKTKEAERLQAELQPLEAKKQNSTAAAAEARRRKEAALGGVQDDLEERGRWWRASETALKQMLETGG